MATVEGTATVAAPATTTTTTTTTTVIETGPTQEITAETMRSTVTHTVTETVSASSMPTTTKVPTSEKQATPAVTSATFTARAGFLAKALGQQAGLGDPDADHLGAKFQVTEIRPGITCTSKNADKPQH